MKSTFCLRPEDFSEAELWTKLSDRRNVKAVQHSGCGVATAHCPYPGLCGEGAGQHAEPKDEKGIIC